MVRYYSNAHKGEMRWEEVDTAHLPIIEEDHFVPSRGWAEMIRTVYEVDPLLCPSCGGHDRYAGQGG